MLNAQPSHCDQATTGPEEIFDKFDLDGQGRLEIDEFKRFLKTIGDQACQ